MPLLTLIAHCVTLMCLLCMSAFFSGTETAFYSLDSIQRKRISREQDGSRGRTVLSLLGSRKSQLLNTILLGNTMVNVAAAALAASVMENLIPGERGLVLSMLIMTFLILVAGEIAPKTWAFGHNSSWALRSAPVVRLLVRVLRPLTALLSLVSRAARRISGTTLPARSLKATELVSLVELGKAEGVLGAEAAVTAALLSLEDRQCREAMVPRSAVSVVRTDWERQRMIEFLRGSPYSRIPVLHGPGESVPGYLEAAEVLLCCAADDTSHPGDGDIPVPVHGMLFFPENASLDVVLEKLRDSGEPMGAVVDEYGDWVGIVTLSDILTLAVFHGLRKDGDLPEGVARRGTSYVVPASIRLEVLSSLLGIDLDAEYAESCGGLLEEVTGRVPDTGERINLPGVHFLVLGSDGRRLGSIEVRRSTQGDEVES